MSPERYAADHLVKLMTFIAARIILHQWEGRESIPTSRVGPVADVEASPLQSQYQILLEHLENGMSNPDKWLEELMEKDPVLALRVSEVRDSYVNDGFEWQNLARLCKEEIGSRNVKIRTDYAAKKFVFVPSDSED